MVNTMGPAPLFCYVFRPGRKRSRNGDGGFNVALYPDSTLAYCRFNMDNQVVEESWFKVPEEVTDRYLMILQSQSWWLSEQPLHVSVKTGIPAYSCMFGFAGHPLMTVDEIDSLVLRPFNNMRGMYARRLRVMLEFVAELLYSCGMGLTVDSFVWNWQIIQPITPVPQNMQMVQPTAEQMPGAENEDDIYNAAQ